MCGTQVTGGGIVGKEQPEQARSQHYQTAQRYLAHASSLAPLPAGAHAADDCLQRITSRSGCDAGLEVNSAPNVAGHGRIERGYRLLDGLRVLSRELDQEAHVQIALLCRALDAFALETNFLA